MFLDKYRHYVLGLLRIVLGYAFVLHGTAKFWEFPMSMTGGNGSVELASLMGVGGVIELVFGIILFYLLLFCFCRCRRFRIRQ